jgi:hypothetical protein
MAFSNAVSRDYPAFAGNILSGLIAIAPQSLAKCHIYAISDEYISSDTKISTLSNNHKIDRIDRTSCQMRRVIEYRTDQDGDEAFTIPPHYMCIFPIH